MAPGSEDADDCDGHTMGRILEHEGDEVDISAAEIAQEMLVVDESNIGTAKTSLPLDSKKQAKI